MASRMERTISTARIGVSSIGWHLARGGDGQRLVPVLEVHTAEQPNLIKPHDVLEVPADQHVHLGYGCKRDVQHVRAKSRREHSAGFIGREEVQGFVAHRNRLANESE